MTAPKTRAELIELMAEAIELAPHSSEHMAEAVLAAMEAAGFLRSERLITGRLTIAEAERAAYARGDAAGAARGRREGIEEAAEVSREARAGGDDASWRDACDHCEDRIRALDDSPAPADVTGVSSIPPASAEVRPSTLDERGSRIEAAADRLLEEFPRDELLSRPWARRIVCAIAEILGVSTPVPAAPEARSIPAPEDVRQQRLIDALRAHHQWHIAAGIMLQPVEGGEPVEIDLTEAYCESALYEQTVAAFPPPINLDDSPAASAETISAQTGTDYMLTELRQSGWSVAVHNDYRLAGKSMTFWLLTHPDGRWIKGEGETDADALISARGQAAVLAALDSPAPSARTERAPAEAGGNDGELSFEDDLYENLQMLDDRDRE